VSLEKKKKFSRWHSIRDRGSSMVHNIIIKHTF
jgi:hypothetical protein